MESVVNVVWIVVGFEAVSGGISITVGVVQGDG
jgi:hypothetical protein